MKITRSQLRRIIRESLEEESQVDPVDQKLYDTFLLSGVMALSLAESGLGSPELVSKMKAVVDHVKYMRSSWDPKDKERMASDPDYREFVDARGAALRGDAGPYAAQSQKSPGRIALSEVGKFMKDRINWNSLSRGMSPLQDLAYTLQTAELAWKYPYTLKDAKHREPKLEEMFEWAGA